MAGVKLVVISERNGNGELLIQKRSGMAMVLKGSHSSTCTPTQLESGNLPLPSQLALTGSRGAEG